MRAGGGGDIRALAMIRRPLEFTSRKRKLEEAGTGNGIEAIGRNLLKTKRTIESLRLRHFRQRVEAHEGVTDLSRGGNHCERKRAANSEATKARAHVETFHLASVSADSP